MLCKNCGNCKVKKGWEEVHCTLERWYDHKGDPKTYKYKNKAGGYFGDRVLRFKTGNPCKIVNCDYFINME